MWLFGLCYIYNKMLLLGCIQFQFNFTTYFIVAVKHASRIIFQFFLFDFYSLLLLNM